MFEPALRAVAHDPALQKYESQWAGTPKQPHRYFRPTADGMLALARGQVRHRRDLRANEMPHPAAEAKRRLSATYREVAAVADEPRAEAPPPVPVEPAEPAAFQERLTEPAAAPVMPSLDLDFSAFPSSPGAPATPAAAVAPAAEEDDFGLDFTLDDPVPADTAAAPVANPPPSPSAVDFDLDALSLDLDTPPEAPSIPDDITGSVPSPEDALATKLALAEEFAAIGDADGARHLVEEVIAEAKELAADGVRELVVVAQDTTYYGLDLYGETRLPELLRQLEQVEGLDWMR